MIEGDSGDLNECLSQGCTLKVSEMIENSEKRHFGRGLPQSEYGFSRLWFVGLPQLSILDTIEPKGY